MNSDSKSLSAKKESRSRVIATSEAENGVNGRATPQDENNVKNYPRKQSRTSSAIKVTASIPKNRETLKWCGWGFKDSGFCRVDGVCKFLGDRYLISGKNIPHLNEYLEKKVDIDAPMNFHPRNNPEPREEDYPISKFTQDLLIDIKYLGFEVSTTGIDRLRRSGGQAFDEVWRVLDVTKLRIPDAVAWPTCHEDCVELVKLAHKKNFVIVPYGGGTCVSGALMCVDEEQRPILSVDTNLMNEILCVDEENLLVTAEAGIIGADLEAALKTLGYTTGHDPDSIEVSTLGGWVSTRASGMKKNKYGNIEDMVVHMRMVTPSGVFEKGSKTERMSCGPDLNHLILGSEGIFGIITEVTIKIREVPECTMYDSVIFPDYYTGIKFMREIAKRRMQPANIRLLDEEQFQVGWAMRAEKTAIYQFFENMKMKLLEKIKGYDPEKISLVTMVHEGTNEEVPEQMSKIMHLASEMGGIRAGETAGKGGYMMTLVAAYIRDIALEFNIIAESIEATVPWDKIVEFDKKVKEAVKLEGLRVGVSKPVLSSRISQVYENDCCIYMNFALRVPLGVDIIKVNHFMRKVVKDVCRSFGASISHHHGIGKQKRKGYEEFISIPGANVLRATKQQLDPKNIFASGNFLEDFKIKKTESEELESDGGERKL